MTTVGYGDLAPVTPFGRVISVVNALWGSFIISMMVSVFNSVLYLSENEKKAIVEICNSGKAARSIKVSLEYYQSRKEMLSSASTANSSEQKNQIEKELK